GAAATGARAARDRPPRGRRGVDRAPRRRRAGRDRHHPPSTMERRAMDEPDWMHDRGQFASYELDWTKLFAHTGDDDARWLVEPFLAAGRGHALYAPAKVGKSFLALHVAAAIATGRACLYNPAAARCAVVYVDYEMSP